MKTALYDEIDRLKAENKEIARLIEKAADFIGTAPELRSIACIDVALDHAETIRMELNEARAERDGYRNGQAQMQTINFALQDTIKKYADERKELKAEIAEQRVIIEQHDDWEYLTKIDKLKAELMKWKATAEELNDALALMSRDRDYWQFIAQKGWGNEV